MSTNNGGIAGNKGNGKRTPWRKQPPLTCAKNVVKGHSAPTSTNLTSTPVTSTTYSNSCPQDIELLPYTGAAIRQPYQQVTELPTYDGAIQQPEPDWSVTQYAQPPHHLCPYPQNDQDIHYSLIDIFESYDAPPPDMIIKLEPGGSARNRRYYLEVKPEPSESSMTVPEKASNSQRPTVSTAVQVDIKKFRRQVDPVAAREQIKKGCRQILWFKKDPGQTQLSVDLKDYRFIARARFETKADAGNAVEVLKLKGLVGRRCEVEILP